MVSAGGFDELRWGKYLPVSAAKVEPPEFIVRAKPDLILITNPVYAAEIWAHVRRLGHRCEFAAL